MSRKVTPADKALIRSGMYGDTNWMDLTVKLIKKGLSKEQILKELADPYVKAGTTERFARKRAEVSYEMIMRISGRHKKP